MFPIIAHLDMDAFFAAIEERDNPQFANQPIVVGADPKNGQGRGVVSTANYKARKYGIHSAQPIITAWRLAQSAQKSGKPKTIFLPVNGKHYQEISGNIIGILKKNVALVEQTSIDEAYLDLAFTGGFRQAQDLALRIKQEIYAKEGLTASVGIGPNKLIAKLASDKNKPDGLTVIWPDKVTEFIGHLPIGDIPGIGPKTEEFLHKRKIYKVDQLSLLTKNTLVSWFGKWGSDIYDKAQGSGETILTLTREVKSVSEQETFEIDTFSPAEVLDKVGELSKRVFERMAKEKIQFFKTVTLCVRFADFETKTRAHTLSDATSDPVIFQNEIIKLILPFLDKRQNPKKKKIRLLGVGMENFKDVQRKQRTIEQIPLNF